MTKWTRNKCLLLGVLLLLLGIQFRLVKTVTFSPEASEMLAKYLPTEKEVAAAPPRLPQQFFATTTQAPPAPAAAAKKTIEPPKWIGLAMISTGAVLVLNSFVMPRSEGGGA